MRTPASRFGDLPDFPGTPRHVEIDGLRIAWVEAGPADAPRVLLMHGEPTWSFLWRRVMPPLTRSGLRAVAPDLPGFGRSDKPSRIDDYRPDRLVGWMEAWMDRAFRRRVPGARGRRHATIPGAGHFLQEDRGEELGRVVADFALRTR